MKRFLISFLLGITLMAIGTTMLVFEIKDFTFVDGTSLYINKDGKSTTSETFRVTNNNRLRIDFKRDDIDVKFAYDETLGDKVIVDINDNIDYKVNNNHLNIYDWQSRHNVSYSIRNSIDAMNTLIDGLKDRKVYTLDYYEFPTITVHCTSEMKKYISIDD